MTGNTDVAIIGAGPYGLSIAAHLRSLGLSHRIIGFPMQFWRQQMPKGMLLKSDAFASSLSDPNRKHTLQRYCETNAIPYAQLGIPVSLETFNEYGTTFQQALVPELERSVAVSLERSPGGFLLQLDDGGSFETRKVILAVGVGYFRFIPDSLAHLPAELLSHSSDHHELSSFKGRDVTVIGAGSSAIDLAVLLQQSGAIVQVVARRPHIEFHGEMQLPRPYWQRIRRPLSGIGPGWRPWLYANAPSAFRYLPEETRLRTARTFLGPAGGWFMKDAFDNVPHLLGYQLERSSVSNGRASLQLSGGNGQKRELIADHVIAATGYRVNLNKIPFISKSIRAQLKSVGNAPALSSHFESSLPGLYFVGPAAVNTFGPVMRFVAGADYTSRRIAKHLAASG
jgi:cation diffusion facilitator CzcD-associated flavoprotein CzcO